MLEKNIVYYDEGITIAQRLNKEGQTINIEYIRRALDKGTHTQIALLLEQWQKQDNNNLLKIKKEILNKEPQFIKMICQAIMLIKKEKIKAVEEYHKYQNELMNSHRETETKVRNLKKHAYEKLLKLQKEYRKLKITHEQKILELRNRL